MHGAKPAQPHQLGNAAGVGTIGLDRHGLERRAHMARLEQFHRQAGRLQLGKEPLRNGPASRPMRAMGVPWAANQAISASGSQATLASFRILPCASTMHTFTLSNDTSIPAYCSMVVPR